MRKIIKKHSSLRTKGFAFSFLFGFLSLFWNLPASAQTLFQNNNQNCESELVACTSVTGNTAICDQDAVSIACRNISGIADFNGDGFPDCVASVGDTEAVNGIAMSVFINKGSGATSCTPGPGDQFNPSLDYVLSGLASGSFITDVGTATAGQLDGTGVTDIAIPQIGTAPAPKHVSSVFNPNFASLPDESVITTTDVDWELTGSPQNGFNFESTPAERGMALFDCDNNGTLDAVIGVLDSSNASLPVNFRINILKNSGSGLQAISGSGDSFDTGIAVNDSPTAASLAVGDFNNDGFLDVVMAIQLFAGSSGGSKVVVCLNNQNCGFTCSTQINLEDAHPNDSDPTPTSIAAGNFDGDANGNVDIVITEPSLNTTAGIHYYFGNGDGTFQAGGMHMTLDQPTQRNPQVLTTGCFNNDNVVDVAVSCNESGGNNGSVQVITSNGSGGFNPQLPLLVNSETFSPFNMAGIDAADFDKQGGDDIIVLGNGDTNGREAFIFMNTVETPAANAGPDQTVATNTPLAISGASCSINPVDPNNPATFAIQWTVTSSPAGASPTLSGATTLTPTFQTATPGTYTLQLDCLTRCKDHTIDAMQITVPTPPASCGNGIVETGEQCEGTTCSVTLTDGTVVPGICQACQCTPQCVIEGSGCGDNANTSVPCVAGTGTTGGASLVPVVHPTVLAQWIAAFGVPGAVFTGLRVRRKRK